MSSIPRRTVAALLTREEEIEVMANDLIIALRGRIERGADFGMVEGDWERTGASDKENFSEEAWSAAKDD